MNINCYCLGEYSGYINNGIPKMPPLGQFSGLPWELQENIIKRAIGPNIPQSLAQMELISSEWKNYILTTLWPRFVRESFHEKEIEMAQEILFSTERESTWKNIYRLLSTRTVLNPEMKIISKTFTPQKPFRIFAANLSHYPLILKLSFWFRVRYERPPIQHLDVETKNVSPNSIFVSFKYNPGENYTLYLSCTMDSSCNAFAGVIDW